MHCCFKDIAPGDILDSRGKKPNKATGISVTRARDFVSLLPDEVTLKYSVEETRDVLRAFLSNLLLIIIIIVWSFQSPRPQPVLKREIQTENVPELKIIRLGVELVGD